jgi:geranylgeranyl reductase family protein
MSWCFGEGRNFYVYDVLVVGGGPAGLYAADRLARAGRSVALFEEHPQIGLPVHCTGLLASEAFARFALPREAVLVEHRATRFRSSSRDELSYSVTPPETVVVDRSRFDQGLAAQALAAGARLFAGARVVRIQRHRGGVAIRLAGTGPTPQVVRGKLLILATGATYYLHKELDLDLPGRFVQTAQVEADFVEATEVEVYFGNSIAPGSFAWIVPFTRHDRCRARIGLMSDKDAERHLLRFLQSPSVAPRLQGDEPERFRRRPIPLAPLARTFSERVLVVGDAAGLTKPTTGGGIYYSLLSAELAATVAHQALEARDFSARFLSQYQQAWQGRLGGELRWGSWFRRHAERLTDAQIGEAFQLAAGVTLDRLIRERASFNWHSGLIQALAKDRQVRSFLLRVLLERSLRFIRWRDTPTDTLPASETLLETGKGGYV